MALRRTRAYLLKRIPFGDTSRIAVLFGEDVGKLRVISKGYRTPRNPCTGALEPFREIELIYYHRPDRELQLAAHADVLHYHDGLESDLTRYFYASAALELCDLLLAEDDAEPAVYADLAETLSVLAATTGARAAVTFRGFQARACARFGILPELESCAVCEGDAGAARLFSAAAGGFVCAACVSSGTPADAMSSEAAGVFRFLLRARALEVARAYSAEMRPAATEVAGVLERFIAHHVERYRGLKSLKTLGRTMAAPAARPGS